MQPPKSVVTHGILLVLGLVGLFAAPYVPEPDGADIRPGALPDSWIYGGPKCIEEDEFQVHEYNSDFYILRQSGCSHYEKPFLYLIFGEERVLLLDTGAGMPDVARVVMQTIKKWCERNSRESIPLVVAHTHNHSDHVAGDAQFRWVPNVTFVGADLETAVKYWGFQSWPDEIIEYDLGGRVLEIFGVPGHQQASIAVYDPQTAILITGDIVYPGRLYVDDPAAFTASIDRLIDFTSTRVVSHVLGCHIEQTNTPYLEYPIGTIYQPNEHRLEFNRGIFYELQAAVREMGPDFKRLALRDLTIYPVGPEIWKQLRERRLEVEEELRKSQWDQEATP